jgi:hypothetical protein
MSTSVQVAIPGQTEIVVAGKSHAGTSISIARAKHMRVTVESERGKREAECECPPGSDVLQVTVRVDGTIDCGGG